MKTPLNVASDISETVHIYTDSANVSQTTHMVNEFGDFAFECQIEITHDYYGGDASTGEAYDFDITGIDVDVLNVYDEDGQEVGITSHEKRQIEKLFEKNLTFEITKKY